MGTANAFTALVGGTGAYSGFGIYNPLGTAGTAAVKLVLLEAQTTPSVAGTALNSLLLLKNLGTATGFAAGASTGQVFAAGVLGTTTSQRATVFGTGTFSGGLVTAKFLVGLPATDTQVVTPPPIEFNGEITALPGEALALASAIGHTGYASMTWMEVPL